MKTSEIKAGPNEGSDEKATSKGEEKAASKGEKEAEGEGE